MDKELIKKFDKFIAENEHDSLENAVSAFVQTEKLDETVKDALIDHINTSLEEDEVDESAGSETLHAGSKAYDDPKTKFEVITAAIGAMAAAKGEDLPFWQEALKQSMENGKGQGIPDGAAEKNKATIKPHASAAVKEATKEDLGKILAEAEGLTPEFKARASTLFEAALEARIVLESTRLESEFIQKLEEASEGIRAELVEGLDKYLDWAKDEWMKENEVAIQSSLKSEIAEDVINGLRDLLTENNIHLNEEEVEVVDAMAAKIDELESALNDAISANAELQEAVENTKKTEVVKKLSEGLTQIEAEKLQTLSENVDYETLEDFSTKVKTIKESQFVKAAKTSKVGEALEQIDEERLPTNPETFVSPEMKAYTQAISRNIVK
jgi:hypothetical protein